MHRHVARFLLLVGLLGNLGPLALAVVANPHACCVRKAIHRCHESAPASGELTVGDSAACNHHCCGAVGTAQWAQAQPLAAIHNTHSVEPLFGQLCSFPPGSAVSRLQSARAPPQSSIV